MFDWTIRNIQLEPEPTRRRIAPGTRSFTVVALPISAWVFAALCRQQGLNVVMLGIPVAKPAVAENTAVKPAEVYWLAACFSDHLYYLIRARFGDRRQSGKGVATLDEVVTDDSLLRKLDLGGKSVPAHC